MKIINLTAFFVYLFSAHTYSQDYNFNVTEIPENLTVDANSVVRFENVSIEMQSQREMTIVPARSG